MSRWEAWLRTDHGQLGGWYISGTLILSAAVSVAALLGVIWVAGWSKIGAGLLHADWPWLMVAPAGVIISHLGYSLPYREVARVDQGSDLGGEVTVAMVTTGFGPFSPRSGFALDARGLRNVGLTKRDAGRRVLALGMIEYAILAPVTFACALYLLRGHSHAQAGLLPTWVVGVPIGSVAVIGLLLCYHHAGRPDTWWSPVRHPLDAIDRTMSIMRSRPGGPLAVAGMSIYWAADVAVLAACMAVFTHDHPGGPALIVGYATGYALTRRSLPLAGAGAVEALLPFALSWVGYPLATAILAVVAYRVFNLWFAVLPAIAGLHRLRRRQTGGGVIGPSSIG
jgi:glycosyltransferase 2 family protein